jgi:hypothetical protein
VTANDSRVPGPGIENFTRRFARKMDVAGFEKHLQIRTAESALHRIEQRESQSDRGNRCQRDADLGPERDAVVRKDLAYERKIAFERGEADRDAVGRLPIIERSPDLPGHCFHLTQRIRIDGQGQSLGAHPGSLREVGQWIAGSQRECSPCRCIEIGLFPPERLEHHVLPCRGVGQTPYERQRLRSVGGRFRRRQLQEDERLPHDPCHGDHDISLKGCQLVKTLEKQKPNPSQRVLDRLGLAHNPGHPLGNGREVRISRLAGKFHRQVTPVARVEAPDLTIQRLQVSLAIAHDRRRQVRVAPDLLSAQCLEEVVQGLGESRELASPDQMIEATVPGLLFQKLGQERPAGSGSDEPQPDFRPRGEIPHHLIQGQDSG